MKNTLLIFISACLLWSCTKEDNEEYIPEKSEALTDPIDIYFKEHFLDQYGTAVRWKWVDKYVDNTKRVTPPLRSVCEPFGEFINDFWLAPFNSTDPGKEFMQKHFPPEIVLIGSKMFNSDGQSITLGYADAGVRITFTQVNEYEKTNIAWHLLQLRTAEHEYGHIIHQLHGLPDGFQEITPSNYKSNNWLNLDGDVQENSPKISREAISLGMVSNYGTSDENEDFCEILSLYLTTDEKAFNDRYITHEPTEPYAGVDADGNPITIAPAEDAAEMNAGRDFIAVKLKMIKNYYRDNFTIDIDQVRNLVMDKIEAIEAPAKKSEEQKTYEYHYSCSHEHHSK